MPRTRIKICGITCIEDALSAVDAGADAVGIVFHPPAPRFVPPERAAKIIAALPPFVSVVGLFVDVSVAEVLATAQGLRLRHVQLHGHEEPAYVAQLTGFAILKAVRVDPVKFRDELNAWRHGTANHQLDHLRGLVLETGGIKEAGGSGIENNWAVIKQARDAGAMNDLPRLIAAGGLHAGNVGRVVRELRPWAVDVSSGVESTPGRKSIEKMRDFAKAVRDADT